MTNQCRIVIAEGYTILREGLRSLLSANPEFEVVGEAKDGHDAVRRVEKFIF
jgi:DNA-binding NarL/FixJ family response regulator